MDIVYEGLGTSLHWLVILLLIAGAFVLSWHTYRKISGISTLQRFALTGLRTSVLLIVLFVVLNPLFKIIETEQITSEIALIFDNSASATIEKGLYEGRTSYRGVKNALTRENLPEARIRTFGFDRSLFPARPDTLALTGSGTDISRALSEFLEQSGEARALVFVSDGIFNTGRDPSWLASRFPIPIYTVAIGDTAQVRDIVLQDIVHNETGFTNTRTPVTASIRNDGMENRSITVQLRKGNEVLEETEFQTTDSRSVHSVRFELELSEPGLQQYEIFITEVHGEWTTENNRRAFSIEVLDDQLNVMLLSFEIHPDLRMWRTLLSEDERIRIDTRTWLGGERFVEGVFPTSSDSIQLVILHGFPNATIPRSITEQVREYIRGTPVLWLASPKTDFQRLRQEFPVSALSGGRGTERFDVIPASPEQEISHPILELPTIDVRTAPPLRAPIRNLTTDANATVLFTTNYRGTNTMAPLLVLQTIGNNRYSFLTAHGWFRWYLQGGEIRAYTETLLSNVIAWTSTTEDDALLRIRPTRTVFEESEPVSFHAFLRNESGTEEDGAQINLSIRNEDGAERQFSLRNQGLGQYRLEASAMPRGNYTFRASAQKDGRIIDERSGDFSVGSTNLEFIQTVRNDELLQFMSDNTGGRFYTWKDADQVFADLIRDGHTQSITQEFTREIRAYQHPLWFILVILLLTAEWGIRKVASLP